MSANHAGGNQVPSIEREEHRSVNGVDAKAVAAYGYDGANLIPVKVSSTGVVETNATVSASGLATEAKQDTTITAVNNLKGFAHVPGADTMVYTSASTTDTYTYKSGGTGGTTVGTVTITYTDSTKETITSVVRT